MEVRERKLQCPTQNFPSSESVPAKEFGFFALPPEMKLEVLSCFDRQCLLNFRLAAKECNAAVFQLKPITFDTCTLSDLTFKYALNSKEFVRHIRIENLTYGNITSLIDSENIIQSAEELTISQKIHPQVLFKILKEGDKVHSLVFELADHFTIDCFVSTKRFNLVNKLQLNVNLSKTISENDELVFRKLSEFVRFPALESFQVDWNFWSENRGLREMHSENEKNLQQLERLHSIYIATHKILYNHKETIKSINWDFSGILVIDCFAGFRYEQHEYWDIKFQINEIQLQNINIKVCEMEGLENWDLCNALLMSQTNLQTLNYVGKRSQFALLADYSFAPLPVVFRNNKSSLREITLKNRAFAFLWLRGCDSLEKLYLTGCNVSSHSVVGMPQNITHLNLDIKYVFPQDSRNLTLWIIEHLPNIIDVSFKLKLMWCNASSFPSSEDFPSLFQPSKLKRLVIEYEATTASGLHLIALQSNRLERISESRRFQGVNLHKTIIETVGLTTYRLEFTIDRNVFMKSNEFRKV